MSFSVSCDMKFEMSFAPSVLKNRKAGEDCLSVLRNSRMKSNFRHAAEEGSPRFSFFRSDRSGGRKRTSPGLWQTIFPCRVTEF